MSARRAFAYRADIDGLRAIAVGLVVAYHAFPERVPGGFIGVDVFFVISGYLITGILLKEIEETGGFSYLGFYARRARRIVPALLMVLAATWFLGRVLLLADEFESLGRHTLAGATFSSNFLLWREAGYFDTAAELKPLLHLWSLSVEEQFYLLWPLLLGVWSRRRLNLVILIGGLLAISLGLDVGRVHRAPSEAFYLLPARFWELLLGCALACVKRRVARPRLANTRSALSLLTLAAVAFFLDKSRPYPGWWALLPTLCAVLVISAGPTAWVNRRLLSSRVAVYVGLISYPLYLWHWPLLSIARLVEREAPSPALRIVIVAISCVLAVLTRRFVEQPVQAKLFHAASPRARAYGYVWTALAALAFTGTLGWLTDGGRLLSAAQRKTAAVAAAYATYSTAFDGYGHCFLAPEEGPESFDRDCYATDGRPAVLIWGDSFARHLYPGLREYLAPTGVRILRLNASSCLPVLGISPSNRPHCRAVNDFVLAQIKAVKPRAVILEGIWFYGYQDEGFFDKLDYTVAELRGAGVKAIVIVGELPMWEPALPKIIQRDYLLRGLAVPERSSLGIVRPLLDVGSAFKRHFAGSTDVSFISATDRLCDQRGCMIIVGDNLFTDLVSFDKGHLTTAGSIYVVRSFIGETLTRALAP